jgi:uncharacterized membrane protein
MVGVAVAILIGYAAIAHRMFASGQGTRLAAMFAVAPIAAALLWWVVRGRHRLIGITAVTALMILLWVAWPDAGMATSALYLAQYVTVQTGLACLFGRTLLAGREPLVARFARSVHGTLPEPIAHYCRGVTLAWTLFFAGMGLLSIVLYTAGPREVWAAFVTLWTAPCVVAMFVIEYGVRRLRFPWFEQVSIFEGIRAFQRTFARRER